MMTPDTMSTTSSHKTTEQIKKSLEEQKREDVFEEIIYNSKRTNLVHLRRVGWYGFPVSTHMFLYYIILDRCRMHSNLIQGSTEGSFVSAFTVVFANVSIETKEYVTTKTK